MYTTQAQRYATLRETDILEREQSPYVLFPVGSSRVAALYRVIPKTTARSVDRGGCKPHPFGHRRHHHLKYPVRGAEGSPNCTCQDGLAAINTGTSALQSEITSTTPKPQLRHSRRAGLFPNNYETDNFK